MSSYFFKHIKDLLNAVLECIYPQSCVICGKVLHIQKGDEKISNDWICKKCIKRLLKYKREKYDEEVTPVIYKSHKTPIQKYFEGLFYLYEYRSIIRQLILNYKFRDSSYISHFFVNEILNSKKFNEIITRYDIIISVPIDKKSEKVRGYNQTAIILKYLSKSIDKEKIIFSTDNLIKVKKTKRQSTLTGIEREENVKGAFSLLRPAEIIGKNLIIFDDIYTTGSTINEISKLLKSNGARKVIAFTLAKD